MISVAIKTNKITPGKSISYILNTFVKTLTEGDIIAISSKIISICENRVINKQKKNLVNLIKRESEFCFNPPIKLPNFFLTLKNNRLIPNAGIDESNCDNKYVLLPKNPQITAKKIWEYLRKRDKLKKLGVIITDSNVTPLRSGVTGITLGWCGFKPLHSYIGKKDLFGRKLSVTQINLLDSLATIATLTMGEGNEQTPIAIIKNIEKITFQNHSPSKKDEKDIHINKNFDLFSTLSFDVTK